MDQLSVEVDGVADSKFISLSFISVAPYKPSAWVFIKVIKLIKLSIFYSLIYYLSLSLSSFLS